MARRPAAPVNERLDGHRYSFDAELWLWEGDAAWHFVSLPEDVADEIAEHHDGRARGFGSVRVEVTIGTSTWRTSVFPDSKRGTYVLPVKQAVRRAQHLAAGDTAHITIATLTSD